MNTLTSTEIRAMRAQLMDDRALMFSRIVEAVSIEMGVSVREIASPTRGKAHVSLARDWACRCAHDRGLTISAIARLLRRDHTSVSAAIARTKCVEPVLIFKSRRA